MDEANTGKAKRKREWVCECVNMKGAWQQYGGHFASLGGVRKMWSFHRTHGFPGPAPAARARNVVTGEIVAL
jgi:hypothetical protein